MPQTSARSSKIRLFRAASFDVAFAALLAVSTTMATSRGLEAQQTRSTTSQRLGFTPNTSLPEPALTGRPATGALFHVTLYTLTWLDAGGSPTKAPGFNRMIALLSEGRLMAMGSMQDRLGSVRREVEQAAADEAIRFFGTEVSDEQLDAIRALLDERLGDFNQYEARTPQAVRTITGRVVEVAREAQERTGEPIREAKRERERSANQETIEEIRNMPGQILRDGVRDATYQVSQAARNKINNKINQVLNKNR